MKIQNPQNQGFTLLELLVVLSILALLAGLVGPQVVKHLGQSKAKAAKVQIEELASALDMYNLDEGKYPTTQAGLAALIEKPADASHWNGPYLRKNKVPQDPWSKDYHYASPGQHGKFDLYSYGADAREGGEGDDKDINNWE